MKIECDSVDVSTSVSYHGKSQTVRVVANLYGADEYEVLSLIKQDIIFDYLGEDTIEAEAIKGWGDDEFIKHVSDDVLLDHVISKFTTKQILEALDEEDVISTVTQHFLTKIAGG